MFNNLKIFLSGTFKFIPHFNLETICPVCSNVYDQCHIWNRKL